MSELIDPNALKGDKYEIDRKLFSAGTNQEQPLAIYDEHGNRIEAKDSAQVEGTDTLSGEQTPRIEFKVVEDEPLRYANIDGQNPQPVGQPAPFFRTPHDPSTPEPKRRAAAPPPPPTPKAPEPRMATWRNYIRTREFWALLGMVFGGMLFLGILIFYVLLPFITLQGTAVTVPEVVNQPLAKAIEQFEDVGLEYEVVDSQYFANLPPLTVLAQDPQPLDRAKPGRRIYLTVNKQTPPNVKMPDIIGLVVDEAGYLLQNWNLKLGNISYTAGKDRKVVVGASWQGRTMKSGDAIPEGTHVDLLVTGGLSKTKVVMPKLVGMSLDEAKAELFSLGLGLADIRIANHNGDLPDGTVFKQLPTYSPEDSVQQGTEFYLFVVGEKPKVTNE
jgi:eukaryotic-like serine/threonine-protein kinase